MTHRRFEPLAVTLFLSSIIAVVQAPTRAISQQPALEKVTTPPALKPLPMATFGRVQPVPGSANLQSQWPGTYFRTAFRGRELFFRVGPNHEILHIVIDAKAPLILKAPEPGSYRIAHLRNRIHTAAVFVATESQSAPNNFGGFAITAEEQSKAPPTNKRQIEFIGDSHTVGYGNTSTTGTCTNEEVWATTDDTQAFGALTAAHYNADYQVNAISGRGVVRNYNGGLSDTLPAAYPYVLFDRRQLSDDPAWHPQVLVIALGTNDFSTPLNPGEKWKSREALHADYEAAYVRFIASLRERNPNAWIILWTTGTENGEIENEAAKVAAQAKSQGEIRLAYLPINNLAFSGCHNHPSVADDKIISSKLEQLIDSTPTIWAGK